MSWLRGFPRLCIMHKGHFVYDGLMDESWYVLDQNDGYGIREPQSVKLGRFMKLEKLSYSLKKTVEEIKRAGIKFPKSIEPYIAENSSDELILEGKNITYRYPGVDSDILNGLNFKIKKGSINALMGFNGAGKSTLMNILSGLEEPSLRGNFNSWEIDREAERIYWIYAAGSRPDAPK